MKEDITERILWEEKQLIENPEPIPDEDFVPAKEAEKDDRPPLIHVDL